MSEKSNSPDAVEQMVMVNRQAESLIHYEVEQGSRPKLWSMSTYEEDDDYRFYDQLLDTFEGVGSRKDALRRSSFIKIITYASETLIQESEGAQLESEEWAARLHGAYTMSDALLRIMPDMQSIDKRYKAFTATPLKSGKTLFQELLLIDPETVDNYSDDEKVELLLSLLEETVDKLNTGARDSYYQERE